MDSSLLKVAVIGGGAAGLSVAFLAAKSPRVHVTIFEERDQLGGHANTVEVDGVPVDTGFLVFNEGSYPNLCGLFEELGVLREPTDMSFAVSLSARSFEWSSDSLSSLFATRSNLISPAFYSMLNDLRRFHEIAPSFLELCETDKVASQQTLREFLDDHKFGAPFCNWYLIPHAAAVWSASSKEVMRFPAATFLRFFRNHSLLQLLDRPQWYTVSRRSREYVRRIVATLPPDRSTVYAGTPVQRVSYDDTEGGMQVVVETSAGVKHMFDHVVFGAHPDQALRMLTSPTAEHAAALKNFLYQNNRAYLHKDEGLMPKNRQAWSSWNYIGKTSSTVLSTEDAEPCCVTYWLNRLQNLPNNLPQLFVTLNPAEHQIPAKHLILAEFNYAHPQYNPESVAAQRQLHALQGVRNTWFCGAYLGYGFHEDAITSGLRVAAAISGQTPAWWRVPMYTVPKILAKDYDGQTRNVSGFPATLTSKEAAVLRSSGGPYWCDNNGNGGPVGRVTAYMQLMYPPAQSPFSSSIAYPEDVIATFQAVQERQEGKADCEDDDTASSTSSDEPSVAPSAAAELSVVSLSELPNRSLGITYRRFSATHKLLTEVPAKSSGVDGASLVQRMAGGMGGYSVHPPSLYLPELHSSTLHWIWDLVTRKAYHMLAAPVLSYLRQSIMLGCVMLRFPDGFEVWMGSASAPAAQRAKICVHSWRFFLRVAAEADLGLARSFMAGEWTSDDLTALFNVFIINRDNNTLSASSLWSSLLGSGLNYLTFTMLLDNSLSGSRQNIHAHYDLSNDLFASFLDPSTMMYSCAFFDTKRRVVQRQALAGNSTLPLLSSCLTAPNVFRNANGALSELVFDGSLADAQIRKLDHLIARAQVQQSDMVLDLGFGWGGLAIRLAETVGCKVHGITLSKEQFDLASQRVKEQNLGHLITFDIADYRDFARDHAGAFNKIISVEMVEAVGHSYFETYIACLDKMLAPNGVIVLQAITIPDARYKSYIRSTDFINSVIFPGGSLPCLSTITAAMAKTSLLITSVDEFGIHYAETLRRWRANFNIVSDSVIPALGFDQQFVRTWNYYFCYCEAGFQSGTLGLQVWTMSRPGCTSSFTAKASGRLASCVGPTLSPSVTYPDCAF